MDTTCHTHHDHVLPSDDVCPRDPWELEAVPRHLQSAPRCSGKRYLWLALLLLTVGGGAALWFTGMRTEPTTGRDDEKPPPATKRTEIGKNLFLEVQGERRRVIVAATVCLREGQLEGLMCRKNTKEHEYILAADVDARTIHAALIAARAKPGTPVQFTPKYVPASGSVIKVTLQYQKDGKLVTVPGQDWIQDIKTNKAMDQQWVFGGSRFVLDPDDLKNPIYLANHGDVICLCNMESAMLDLPVRSPKSPENRIYNAFTERIPPKDTRVEVILEAVMEKK